MILNYKKMENRECKTKKSVIEYLVSQGMTIYNDMGDLLRVGYDIEIKGVRKPFALHLSLKTLPYTEATLRSIFEEWSKR